MILKRFGIAGLIAGLGIAASACTGGYGYGGASLGYASNYYDGYGSGYGPGYGYGSGYGYGPSSYFGWYGDFYYPGTGIYVYDRYRRPIRWNGAQQRYWQDRGRAYRGDRGRAGNRQGYIQGRGNFAGGVRPDHGQGVGAERRDQILRQQFGAGNRAERQERSQVRQSSSQARQARESVGRVFGNSNRGSRRR